MSRIDDALRRLTGAAPEPQGTSGLKRFASEGRSASAGEPRRVERVERKERDEPRIAPFTASSSAYVPEGQAAPVDAPRPRPAMPAAEPNVAPSIEEADENLFDVSQLADYVRFVLHSTGRHKLLVAASFALVFALSVTTALLLPKTYHVQVKMLAQRNAVMTALSNPGRAIPWDADAPTRAAAETVLRRDNLISLIGQTNLLKEWDRGRAPILRLKDSIRTGIVGREMTPDEKLDMLVGLLEDSMIVSAGPVGDGTVTIDLYWPDPAMAYRLVTRAQSQFLDARQAAETSAITESIGILENYSQSLHGNVNRTLTELQHTRGTPDRRGGGVVVRRSPQQNPDPVAAAAAAADALTASPLLDTDLSPDPELTELRGRVMAKRRELERLGEERARQLADAQARLNTLKAVYAPGYPGVQGLQQNVAELQHDSSQMISLRNELKEMEDAYDSQASASADRLIQAELSRRAAVASVPQEASAPKPVVERQYVPPTQTVGPADTDVSTEFSTLRLKTELSQLQSILERTDGARIELAVSQAAFKYRYTIIKPAQEPKQPLFPNVRLLIALGFLASVMLAVGIALVTDLMSNRILEVWQIQRSLGLPVLGTVR